MHPTHGLGWTRTRFHILWLSQSWNTSCNTSRIFNQVRIFDEKWNMTQDGTTKGKTLRMNDKRNAENSAWLRTDWIQLTDLRVKHRQPISRLPRNRLSSYTWSQVPSGCRYHDVSVMKRIFRSKNWADLHFRLNRRQLYDIQSKLEVIVQKFWKNNLRILASEMHLVKDSS